MRFIWILETASNLICQDTMMKITIQLIINSMIVYSYHTGRNSDLICVNLFNQTLKWRHEAWSQVTVLEKHPLPSLHCTPHHCLCTGTLWWKNSNRALLIIFLFLIQAIIIFLSKFYFFPYLIWIPYKVEKVE